jgi:hypothetical protein
MVLGVPTGTEESGVAMESLTTRTCPTVKNQHDN